MKYNYETRTGQKKIDNNDELFWFLVRENVFKMRNISLRFAVRALREESVDGFSLYDIFVTTRQYDLILESQS